MFRDLDKKSLGWAFFVGALMTLIVPALMPKWPLTYFAPFLVIAFYQVSLATCLFFALGCGFFLDLLSGYPIMGLHPASYCAAVVLLYPQKRHVFADSLTTLPLMVTMFSSLSCFFLAFLLDFWSLIHVFSLEWVMTDLVVLPLIDGLVAFALFIFPVLLFGRRFRTAKDYFFS